MNVAVALSDPEMAAVLQQRRRARQCDQTLAR